MNEQLKIIISAEVDKLKKAVGDAKKQVDDFTQDADKGASKMDEAFRKAGDGIKSAVSAMAKGFAAVGAALTGTAIATQEYRDDMAKLAAAYDSANLSTNAAKTAYQDLYRVLGETDQAVEASQQIALLANSEAEVAKWSELAAGVVGTFGDALQPETFYEAANETLKLGEATGAFTQMLEGTGQNVDKFNEGLAACTTEEEKQAYMLKVTQDALGSAGAAFEQTNAKVLAQRDAQMQLNEQLAKVGDAMAPVVTLFTAFAAEALAAVAPYLQSFVTNYLPLLKDLLTGVADALKVAFDWASQHKELLIAIAAAVGVLVTAIGLYNAVSAVKAAMAAAEVATVGALVGVYTAQAAAMMVAIAPYALIAAAIAAVIAIIIVCIKNWDKIKAKVIEVANSMKEKVSDMKNSVVGKFNELKDGITSRVNNIKSKVSSVFNSLKSAITNPVETAKNMVKSAVDKIKGFFNFKWSLPKLKMPHIKISGEFSIVPPKVPKFSIDWYARGGVFDKATLFNYAGGIGGLGEAGAEAIVPLEKNTQWLDKIADKLAAKQNGIPIILQVDGKTFAQVSIDSINALTKQRGTLGLNLV